MIIANAARKNICVTTLHTFGCNPLVDHIPQYGKYYLDFNVGRGHKESKSKGAKNHTGVRNFRCSPFA